MAANGNGRNNGDFSFGNVNAAARNGLTKIQTHKKQNEVCHDDSGPTVKAQTIDELHSLQRKRSAPTTPIKGAQGVFAEEERQKQQLQSIRYNHTHAACSIIISNKLKKKIIQFA